jgi:hypothetical protein
MSLHGSVAPEARKKGGETMAITDAVLLVPGFLGFDHFGGFPYFAQAIPAALRAALEAKSVVAPEALEIVPCDTIPAGSLQQRQAELCKQLRSIVAKLRGSNGGTGPMPRLHLIGHSTGGVDAELLLAPRRLDGSAWKDHQNDIRHAIRSVTSLSAPMAGTNLAASPLARLGSGALRELPLHPVRWWREHFSMEGVREGIAALHAVWDVGAKDAALGQLIGGGLVDRHPLQKFVASLVHNRRLLAELDPAAFAAHPERLRVDPRLSHVSKFRYLTIARHNPGRDAAGELFELLYRLTAADAAPAPPPALVERLEDAIRRGRVRVIGSGEAPQVTAAANDGVVNTARQIPLLEAKGPDPLRRVRAVVVADHLDVLGGFPMTLPLKKGPDANNFLESGSVFRAAQFSALFRAIADDIAVAIAPVADIGDEMAVPQLLA